MVRVLYYGYNNISSNLIHVTHMYFMCIYIYIIFIKGYAVKGLHFDCRSNNNGFNSYISLLLILTSSMVELYIPNISIQVQFLSKNRIFIRELSLMEKHMTFNHYYMSSNLIALIAFN